MNQEFEEMRERFIDEQVLPLLPPEFVIRRGVVINGVTIPLLAVSSSSGAVALLFPERSDTLEDIILQENGRLKKKLNAPEKKAFRTAVVNEAELLKSALALPEGLKTPEKHLYSLGSHIDGGLLVLSVLLFPVPGAHELLKGNGFEQVINGLWKPCDPKLGFQIGSFLEFSTVDLRPLEIRWINRNISLWNSGFGLVAGLEPFSTEKLNSRQNSLVANRTKSGFRRIKGSSGSGKSLVLAARGAKLLLEGRSVLFLTFNIVAARWLCETVSSVLLGSGRTLEELPAEFHHFHELLKSIKPYAGPLEPEKDNTDKQAALDRYKAELTAYLNSGWCDQALSKISDAPSFRRYDAIMVDEGQDLRQNWWPLVRELLLPEGEILLVADRTQNVYGIPPWTEESMRSTGFRGGWVTLEGSYRLPDRMLLPMQSFIRRFLQDGDTEVPTRPRDRQASLLSDVRMRWIQLDEDTGPDETAAAAHREYMHIVEESKRTTVPVEDGDVVFLTFDNVTGLSMISEFTQEEIPYFSTINDSSAKHSFSVNFPAVKLTTVKSFKGLEARVIIVLATGRNASPRMSSELYVALTRVRDMKDRHSFISVICSNGAYSDFGAEWPGFGGEFIDMRRVDLRFKARNIIIEPRTPIREDILFTREFYDLILKHAGSTAELDVNANLENSAEQNAAYLHDYFFRSFTESAVLWGNVLAHPAYAEHLRSSKRLRVLSYGCGTGGDAAGLAEAVDRSCLLDGGTLEITGVEGNADALEKCGAILRSLSGRWPAMKVEFIPIQFRVENCAFLEGLPLEGTFDIIETSKMINELLPDNFGAYYQFLDTVVRSHLPPDGLALISDVPVMRTIREQTGEFSYGSPELKWAPGLLADAASGFEKNSGGAYSVVLPVPCGGCEVKRCYSAALYSYRFFSEKGPLVKSPLCMRLIAGSEIAQLLDDGKKELDNTVYVTCRRKNGAIVGCRRGPCSAARPALQNKNLSRTAGMDGYRFNHG